MHLDNYFKTVTTCTFKCYLEKLNISSNVKITRKSKVKGILKYKL